MAFDNYFQRYGNMYADQGVTPALLSEMARLESGYRANAMNDWDSNAKAGTPSGGLMQFIAPTFSGYLREAQQDKPGIYNQWTAKDWMNPEAQVAVAANAIGAGKGSAWATYDRARGGGNATGNESIKYGGSAPQGAPAIGGSPQQAFIQQAFAEDPEIGAALAGSLQRPTGGSGGGSGSGGSGISPYTGGYDYAKFPRLKGELPYQWLQRIGQQKFGLRNDPGNAQTFGGQHAAGSAHYENNAIDWGNALNTPQQLNQANQYFSNMPGVSTIWQAPGHYDHLHAGVG